VNETCARAPSAAGTDRLAMAKSKPERKWVQSCDGVEQYGETVRGLFRTEMRTADGEIIDMGI